MPPVRNTFLTRSFSIGNYSSCFADLAAVYSGNGNHAFDRGSNRNPFTLLEKNGKEETTKVFILFDSYGSVIH